MKHVAGGLHHIFSEYNKIKQQELKIAHGQKTGKNKQTVSMHQFTATVSCPDLFVYAPVFQDAELVFRLFADRQTVDGQSSEDAQVEGTACAQRVAV